MMELLNQNVGLIGIAVVFVLLVVAMTFKESVLDFVKANMGLLVLLTLFCLLLAVAFHVFHEATANPAAKDFLDWLKQKAGEVLASVMTLIVGIKAANGRSSDGNGKVPPQAPPAAVTTDHP